MLRTRDTAANHVFSGARVACTARSSGFRLGFFLIGCALVFAGCAGRSFRISDAVTGAPIAGAMVQCGPHTTHTDRDGRARIPADDTAPLIIHADGYAWFSGARSGEIALTPAWLGRFADGGDVHHPATIHGPVAKPCLVCPGRSR